MTTLQEYLNQKYPTREEKEKEKEINLENINRVKELEGGKLDLKKYKLGLNSKNKDYPGRIEENFYNRFYGSLEPIKNLTKLEEFCIAATDIEEGIEYIPELIGKKSHEEVLKESNPSQNEIIDN